MTLGKKVGVKLVNLMQEIKDGLLPLSPSVTKQVIEEHRNLVASVLRDDPDLSNYRANGKGLYKALQKIAAKFPQNQDFRYSYF